MACGGNAMNRRNSWGLTATIVNLPKADIPTLAALAELDGTALGDQIRRAVSEYLERRASELKKRKVILGEEFAARRNLGLVSKPRLKR